MRLHLGVQFIIIQDCCQAYLYLHYLKVKIKEKVYITVCMFTCMSVYWVNYSSCTELVQAEHVLLGASLCKNQEKSEKLKHSC